MMMMRTNPIACAVCFGPAGLLNRIAQVFDRHTPYTASHPSEDCENVKIRIMGVSLSTGMVYIGVPPQVTAGNALKGSVFLNVLEPTPTSRIYFQFKGRDKYSYRSNRRPMMIFAS